MTLLVCALGDLVLDVVVRPVRTLVADADTPSTNAVGPGGQAANVAAWVAALGGRARFVGVRAGDAAGRLAEDGLASHGVEVVGPSGRGRGGVVVSLVGPAGRRTMASDRGVSPELEPSDLDGAWFADCDWLYVSGYGLLGSPIDEASVAAARLARAAGARIAVDLAAWTLLEERGRDRFRSRLDEVCPDVLFANQAEAEALGGPLPAPSWVLKRGAAGSTFRIEPDEPFDLPAPVPHEVLDTTGAGDALAAGYLVGGPQLALDAAACCVAKLGAQP